MPPVTGPFPGSPRSRDLDRRALLRIAAATAGLAAAFPWLASNSEAAPSPRAIPEEAQEIAPGIYVHKGLHALMNAENQGDIANVGFVVGTTAVAVIDTGGSARVGAAIKAAIRRVTDKPIRYVINTHMHPDHVFGDAAFEGDGVEFVGHHKLARGLSARSERYLALNGDLMGPDAFAGTKVILPTRAITEETSLDLGGRKLTLTPQKTAHTDNDLLVEDSTTGTLFMGDLLFSEHIPTIDGSIVGWLALLKALQEKPKARIVPGHGPVSMPWPEAAAPITHYLDVVATEVRALVKANRTIEDAVATVGLSEKSAWLLFEEYHARNVSAAFAELEWE